MPWAKIKRLRLCVASVAFLQATLNSQATLKHIADAAHGRSARGRRPGRHGRNPGAWLPPLARGECLMDIASWRSS